MSPHTHTHTHTHYFTSRDGIGSRGGGVDIADLTWEQKEQCLRLLFARMNRHKTTSSAGPLAALPAPPTQTQHHTDSPSVFITEQSHPTEPGERGVASAVDTEYVQTTLEQVT